MILILLLLCSMTVNNLTHGKVTVVTEWKLIETGDRITGNEM